MSGLHASLRQSVLAAALALAPAPALALAPAPAPVLVTAPALASPPALTTAPHVPPETGVTNAATVETVREDTPVYQMAAMAKSAVAVVVVEATTENTQKGCPQTNTALGCYVKQKQLVIGCLKYCMSEIQKQRQ